MPKSELTDAQVEQEIARLENSPYVRLARKEIYAKNARRQRMYQLRSLEKRGKELEAQGKDDYYFDEIGDYAEYEE